MINSPFSNKTFSTVWLKHFHRSEDEIRFNFIEGISFVKTKYLPLYFNIGKNLTNGISYSIKNCYPDYKKKIFFLYDIPEHFNVKNVLTGSLKLKTIKQYKGYLANLKGYENLQQYINDNFSSRSRRVFKKNIERLEFCFNINYTMYYGNNISKNDYSIVFDQFNKLLKKRYSEKQINNHYLTDKKWNYLYELVYPMILNKKASLFVIYNDNMPINVSLNYISENICFGALTAFDTDYFKYNIGFIDIMKHLEWCLKENIEIFDFSKGEYDYKKRWSNKEYFFDYHILYDSKSITATLLYQIIFIYFKIKQFLRDLNMHILFHQAIFYLKRRKPNTLLSSDYEIVELDELHDEKKMIKMDFHNIDNSTIKKWILDFLFKNSELLNSIMIYKVLETENTYIVKGKTKIEKIIFQFN